MIRSAEEFVWLRESDEPREYLRAANEAAPTEVWRDIIERMPTMREWVALNKTLPEEIHELLAKDESARVRASLADRRQLPLRIIQKLSEDPEASVRARIACNRKTPLSVISRLASDTELIVSQAAKCRLRNEPARQT